jgi:Rrf2 family protein
MRITYKGDYALKAVLDLSTSYGNGVVSIHEMAKRLDIPIKFLEQILLDLKRGGFVESRRGKIGGYLLARPPEKIKLGEVIRYIDGSIEPIACANPEKKYTGCMDIHRCVFKKLWQSVARATATIVDNTTFQDLVKECKLKSETIIYNI